MDGQSLDQQLFSSQQPAKHDVHEIESAPQRKQDHYPPTMKMLDGQRLESAPSIYHFPTEEAHAFVHMSEVMVCGPQESVRHTQ